jgi:hypothetical protein
MKGDEACLYYFAQYEKSVDRIKVATINDVLHDRA